MDKLAKYIDLKTSSVDAIQNLIDVKAVTANVSHGGINVFLSPNRAFPLENEIVRQAIGKAVLDVLPDIIRRVKKTLDESIELHAKEAVGDIAVVIADAAKTKPN